MPDRAPLDHGHSEHDPKELDDVPNSGRIVFVGVACSRHHAERIAREHGTDYVRTQYAPVNQAYLVDLDAVFKIGDRP